MKPVTALLMAFLGTVGACLIIVSLTTDHWEDFEGDDDNYNTTDPVSLGLWRICRRNGCVHFSEITISNTLKAVRAFVFMAMLICWAGVLFAVRKAFGKPDSKHFMLINFFFAPFFLFIGMIIYTALDIENEFFTAEVSNEDIARERARFWGYSYVIGWITFFLTLVTFILGLLFSRSPKSADNA